MRRPPLPVVLPLLAMGFVVVCGGGLGVSFIALAKAGAGIWGAIIIGLALVVGVPLIGGLLTLPRR